MKVTTEKLPKSRIALDIELDNDQVQKGLERAARRLSQKYNIPGFRKGKAPRFIIENYFGRDALIDEASDDVFNKAFQQALKQEAIEPVGKVELESSNMETEPYSLRVLVPVAPSVVLADYQAIRSPHSVEEITDAMLDHAMESRRERHVVLRELEEPRPAQSGDELTVEMEAFADDAPLDPRPEGQPIQPSTLILEPDRLADGLYDALLGTNLDQFVQVISKMPENHSDERIRGKDVNFSVKVLGMKERLLPEWDELTTLEEFEGSLDELRAKTRTELEETARTNAERSTLDAYIKQLVEQTEFDLPDVLIEREADSLLQEREAEFVRYGIKPEQFYEYQGRERQEYIDELLPQAEERLRTTLALQEIIKRDQLSINDDDVNAEIDEMLKLYGEDQRENIRQTLSTSLRHMMANTALDKKLRQHMLAIAKGEQLIQSTSDNNPSNEETASSTDMATSTQAQDEPVVQAVSLSEAN